MKENNMKNSRPARLTPEARLLADYRARLARAERKITTLQAENNELRAEITRALKAKPKPRRQRFERDPIVEAACTLGAVLTIR